MSTPITACRVYKAAFGDEDEYEGLIAAIKLYLACGHWSKVPCNCDPPCPRPSEEQLDALEERLAGHWDLKEEK